LVNITVTNGVTASDIGRVVGSARGKGIVTLYDTNNEKLCTIEAWSNGGAIGRIIRLQNEYYISVIKNRSGSTMHIYNLACELVTKKKLSPKLHPRRMDVGEIFNRKTSQEIVVAAHRGKGVCLKVIHYNPKTDTWRTLKRKYIINIPEEKYKIEVKRKTDTVLIKNKYTGKVYYKWVLAK